MSPRPNPFETDLEQNAANYVPLSPLTFIARAAAVYPQRTAVVHGKDRFTWAESYARCRRLASALGRRGIGRGDTVAVMAANIPALFEAHFGVPMTGAVLNALNIRLDAETIAFILGHGEAKVLLTDTEFAPVIGKALKLLERRPLVIDIDDPHGPGGERLGEMTYDDFLTGGDPEFEWSPPADEWQAIALNYTSGTTGNPKGVVYHHRGAYLNALGNALVWNMPPHPVYLWTLPMFHCNGWCFPWTVTALNGTHACLRRVAPREILHAIVAYGVTHLCGAPIVMNMLINAEPKLVEEFTGALGGRVVELMTAAAPPPAPVIEKMERMGFHITHVYGLTEVYGPAVVCDWHDEWNGLPPAEQARLKSRQGVRYPVIEGLMVADPQTLAPVPADGQTMGEVFFRGNIVMKGYLEESERHRRSLQGRLVPLGRSRRAPRRRLYRAQGPFEGHHHLRRREHLDHRGRGRALPPPGGAGGGRGRAPGRDMGRDALRLRHAQGRRWRHRRRTHQLLPRQSGALQSAADGRVRPAPEDLDRQGAEVCAPTARRRIEHIEIARLPASSRGDCGSDHKRLISQHLRRSPNIAGSVPAPRLPAPLPHRSHSMARDDTSLPQRWCSIRASLRGGLSYCVPNPGRGISSAEPRSTSLLEEN